MAAIKVKLVRGLSRVPANQRVVVAGLGLKKTNSTKILPDTPQTDCASITLIGRELKSASR